MIFKRKKIYKGYNFSRTKTPCCNEEIEKYSCIDIKISFKKLESIYCKINNNTTKKYIYTIKQS